MALTNEDLQAISGLLDMKLRPIDCRLDNIETRLDKVETRLDKVEIRLDRLESEMSGLKIGQAEIRDHMKELDQKISETNELALDAWGTSIENRIWLEQRKRKSLTNRRAVSRKVKV